MRFVRSTCCGRVVTLRTLKIAKLQYRVRALSETRQHHPHGCVARECIDRLQQERIHEGRAKPRPAGGRFYYSSKPRQPVLVQQHIASARLHPCRHSSKAHRAATCRRAGKRIARFTPTNLLLLVCVCGASFRLAYKDVPHSGEQQVCCCRDGWPQADSKITRQAAKKRRAVSTIQRTHPKPV